MVSRRREGFVLVVALFVLAVTLSAMAVIAGSLGYRMWLLRQEARSVQLTALTDAALAKALAELSRDADYGGTDGAEPFGDGTFAITARRVATLRAVVEVRATYAGGRRAVRADVDLDALEVTRWQPIGFSPARDRAGRGGGERRGPDLRVLRRPGSRRARSAGAG